MNSAFDPGALLARSYVLPSGPRVCLRLARPRDAGGIRALWRRNGLEPDELEIARLVRCAPRERIVICATALIGSAETILGLGAITLDHETRRRPALLAVDESRAEGLEELLTAALVGRAEALTRARAA